MKICCRCHKKLSIVNFYTDKTRKDGLHPWCKLCQTKSNINWQHNNKIKVDAYNSTWRKKNPKKCRQYTKRWRKQNPNYRIQINVKLAKNLSKRINCALKGVAKSSHTIELLGCSVSQLIKHLEKRFKKGMTWTNYGKWHVDHIKPLSSFDLTKPKQQKLACNYKNLQPLWASENFKKNRY